MQCSADDDDDDDDDDDENVVAGNGLEEAAVVAEVADEWEGAETAPGGLEARVATDMVVACLAGVALKALG